MRSLVFALISLLTTFRGVATQRTSGDLRFDPVAPRRGQVIGVVYRPADALAGLPRVVLRARYRTVTGEIRNAPPSNGGTLTTSAATLSRRRDGTFAGSFLLPDSVVYAAFAIESDGGVAADGNDGKLWELLIHGRDGKPEFDALAQRMNDLYARDWEESFATARRMAALYPERVRGWVAVRSFESQLLGDDKSDSLREIQRRQFAGFEQRFATGPASPEDIAVMAYWAHDIGGDSLAGQWLRRALREAPTHPVTLMERLMASDAIVHRDYPAALVLAETLWTAAGRDVDLNVFSTTMRHSLAGPAQSWAFRVKDTAAITRWSDRYAIRGRYNRRTTALQLTGVPALRDQGMQMLRDELRTLDEARPEHRALGETIADQRKRHAVEARPLFAGLGKALIAKGDFKAGLDTLSLVDPVGWDLALFRSSATARLAVGDTTRAMQSFARVIADPRTPITFADSIAPLARRVIGDAGWSRELAAARADLPRRVLANGLRAPLQSKAPLIDTLGTTRDLSELIKGKLTLVHYWSRFCGPAIAELPAADSMAARLSALGVQAISVAHEVLTPEVRAFARARHLTIPLYHDVGNGLRTALGSRAYPTYWLIDASGNVRYRSDASSGQRTLDELLVQVEALRAEAAGQNAIRKTR